MVDRELLKSPAWVREFYKSLKPKPEWINIDEDALQLAKKYISSGALTQKSFLDAQHIACATIHDMLAIISWNFKHIANFERQKAYNYVNKINGYKSIDVYSPLNFNQINHDDK